MIRKTGPKNALVIASNNIIAKVIEEEVLGECQISFAPTTSNAPVTSFFKAFPTKSFDLAISVIESEHLAVESLPLLPMNKGGVILLIFSPQEPPDEVLGAKFAKQALARIAQLIPSDCPCCLVMLPRFGLHDQTRFLENLIEAITLVAGSQGKPCQSFITFDPLDEPPTFENSCTSRWWDADTERCLRTSKGNLSQLALWPPLASKAIA